MPTSTLAALFLWLFGVQDSQDPADLLQKLSADLRSAINTAAKDLDVRQRLTKLAKATFDKDVASAVPKTPKGAWEFHSEFLEHVALADTHFRGERDKAERILWIAACKGAYARQLTASKELAAGAAELPPVDQVYYDLTQAVARVAKKFARGADEYDKAGYDAAKQAFGLLVPKARAPQGDPKSLYAKWLIEIDRVYSLTTDDQKKQNSTPNAMLKAAAKVALDRALAAPK